jgi:hypothetical protein
MSDEDEKNEVTETISAHITRDNTYEITKNCNIIRSPFRRGKEGSNDTRR